MSIDLSTLGGDHCGQGFCVETRVLEAEAAVHAVGSQLQAHLPDVVLKLDEKKQFGPVSYE